MLRKRERDDRFKRRVGLLAVGSLLALLVFLSTYQHASNPFRTVHVLHAQLLRADGLEPDTRVSMAGLDIGRLRRLTLTERNHVALRLEIEPVHAGRIRADARALVVQPLIGGAFIDIVPGSAGLPPLESGAAIAIERQASLNDVIASLPPRLLKLDQVLEHLVQASGRLDTLTQRLATPEGELDRMLARLAETAEHGAQGGRRLQAQLDTSARVLAEAERAGQQLNRLLGELVRASRHAEPIAAGLEALTERSRLLVDQTHHLVPQAGELLGRGRTTLHDTDEIVRAARQNILLRGSLPPDPPPPVLPLPRGP